MLKGEVGSQSFNICLKEFTQKLDDPSLKEYGSFKALQNTQQYLNAIKLQVLDRVENFLKIKLNDIESWSENEYDYQIGQALMLKNENLYSFILNFSKTQAIEIYNLYIAL